MNGLNGTQMFVMNFMSLIGSTGVNCFQGLHRLDASTSLGFELFTQFKRFTGFQSSQGLTASRVYRSHL